MKLGDWKIVENLCRNVLENWIERDSNILPSLKVETFTSWKFDFLVLESLSDDLATRVKVWYLQNIATGCPFSTKPTSSRFIVILD